MNFKNSAVNQKNKKKRRNPFRFLVYYFIKITGALSVLIWMRPKRLFENSKAKKPIRGAAVAVANHSSFIDPIALSVVLWYRRIHFLTTEDLFKNKFASWFFRSALCIPVKRAEFNMSTFRLSMDVFEEGDVLGIFPEGAINFDDSSVQSFKSGAVLMALKGRVPIVPVYIIPPKKWYNRVVMVIGESINPSEICGDSPSLRSIDDLSQKLREKEMELMEIYSAWKMKKSSK